MYKKILEEQAAIGHYVSLGFDPVIDKIPRCLKGGSTKKSEINIVYDFFMELIPATAGLVQSYKPNFAFFEAYGNDGIGVLEDIMSLLESTYPHVLRIGDCKRGDIGKTNSAYMKMLDKFHAFTIHPYLGGKANEPFYANTDQLVFVLCQTSNDGANEFQGLYTMDFNPAMIPSGVSLANWWDKIQTAQVNKEIIPLYQKVAKSASQWGDNIGFVTGATYPDNLAEIRNLVGPDRILLIPGIGTQGGDLQASLNAGMTKEGNIVVNVSSAALYASSGEDFVEACAQKIIGYNNQINSFYEEKFGVTV